jgi:transposase-like protein
LKKYQIGSQLFAVFEDQLWQAVEPSSEQKDSLVGNLPEFVDEVLVGKVRAARVKLSKDEVAKMVADRKRGMTFREVCIKYNVTPPTVSYWMKKNSNEKEQDEFPTEYEEAELIEKVQALIDEGKNTIQIAKNLNVKLSLVNSLFTRNLVTFKRDDDDDDFIKSGNNLNY